MSVQAGETYRFEQEIEFRGHRYGSTDNNFPRGGECQITRGSDGFQWDGLNFVSGEHWNPTTVDAAGLFHYYDWTVPGSASNGSVYHLRIRIKDDPVTETSGHLEVRPPSGGGIVNKRILVVDDS